MNILQNKFSIQDALAKLWDKLDGWLDALILKLPNIVMAILIMTAFYFIARGLARFFKNVLLKRITQVSIREIISKMIFITVLLIGFFISAGVLGLDRLLTGILAGAGVIGLAIGLALQGTLSDTFGGVVLSFLPHIRINDYIESDTTKGLVSEINLRNIMIQRTDGNYVIVPNSKFMEKPFTNYSLSSRSRISVGCGVGYESDLQQVEDLVTKIITENFEQRTGEQVEFYFTDFGDSSINFITRFWVDMTRIREEYAAKHKAIKLIRQHFRENKINIPFPIRTLDFAKNDLRIDRDIKKEGP